MSETTTAEPDFSKLGPATTLAIRLGIHACDDGIRAAEDKLAIPSLNGEERRHWQTELHGWQVARHQLLTQKYPLPCKSDKA